MILAVVLSASLGACLPVADFAARVASDRQAGVPLSEMLSISGNPSVQALIISAYHVPRYVTKERRSRAVTEFANRVFMQCMEGADKK